jgi:hypothetical protein
MLVAPVVTHPVLVTTRVFPVIVFVLEAAAAFAVELPGAKAIAIPIFEAMLAGLVVTVVVIVIVPAVLLASRHASERQ